MANTMFMILWIIRHAESGRGPLKNFLRASVWTTLF